MAARSRSRRVRKTAVHEARLLLIGELCDGGRAQSYPQGEITWFDIFGQPSARLRYKIYEEHWPQGPTLLILALRYRFRPTAPELPERIILERMGGGAYRARCPRCDRPLRKLYAPRTAEYFLCRLCHGLVYREPLYQLQPARAPVRNRPKEVLAPLLADLEGRKRRGSLASQRRQAEELLAQIEEERPLFKQERRFYCLRLARLGLSLRQSAAALGCSKSSVQRYLAAGLAAIDRPALVRNRLSRSDLYSDVLLASGAGALETIRRALEREEAEPAREPATRKPQTGVLRALGPEEELKGW